MKYRKKPVVIEAEQFFASRNKPPFYYDGNPVQYHESCGPDAACSLCGAHYVQTMEGPLKETDGDWIIKGIKGEFYPCKPDIFEATYDPEDIPANAK